MTPQITDSELMTKLLTLIAEASALGADALVDAAAPNTSATVTLVRWLADAATSMSIASGSRAILDEVQFSALGRERIAAFLEARDWVRKLPARPLGG